MSAAILWPILISFVQTLPESPYVVEFALLTGVGMRKLFWASVVMLVAGYFGESGVTGMLDAQIWGLISGGAYFYMAYEVGCLTIFGGPTGAVGTALNSASGKIPSAGRMLQWYVLVGWAIYPLGYVFGLMTNSVQPDTLNWIYNLADFVNKILFGLFIWMAATKDTAKTA